MSSPNLAALRDELSRAISALYDASSRWDHEEIVKAGARARAARQAVADAITIAEEGEGARWIAYFVYERRYSVIAPSEASRRLLDALVYEATFGHPMPEKRAPK